MREFTNKRLAKAQFMANIFEKYDKTNLPVRDFCDKVGIQTSRFYYWKARFRQEGLKGLVDKRQGKPYKATEDVKRYIWGIKQKDPLKSALDISILVEKRYHKSLSDRHIRNILEEIGLNDPIGRKADKQKIKKRVIKNIIAGFGFILSAASAIKGEEAILKVVMIKRDIRLDGTRICTHKTSTLLRYIRTLFLLPPFDMKRPIELDSYDGKTIGAITSPDGRHARYRTTDRFLRDLTALKVGNARSEGDISQRQ